MDAWTIYWILQLDSINAAISAMCIAGFIVAGILWVRAAELSGAAPEEWDGHAGLKAKYQRKLDSAPAAARLARKVTVWLALPVAMLAFLPTTKTVAAMVVIPAIVNNEALKAEAGDLYQLAKQALREAVDAKPEAAKEQP